MDTSLSIVKLVVQRGTGDCAIATLATYLTKSYEDVFAAAVSKSNPRVHHQGMYIRQIRATAKVLGVKLRVSRKKIDLDSACGILYFENRTSAHVVVIKNSHIYDSDGGVVWDDVDLYMKDQEVKKATMRLIVAVDE